MTKRIYLIIAIVFVLAGLFFLVVPYSAHESIGTVIGGRVGNLITGLAIILIGGFFGYMSFRQGVARDLARPSDKAKVATVEENVIQGRGSFETPPPATAPTPTPPPATEQQSAEQTVTTAETEETPPPPPETPTP